MNAAHEQPRESLWRELRSGERLCDADGEIYVILRFLAEGGYSQVYEAEYERTGELVAIKVLHLKHARNKKTLRRQMQEADTLYELQHPNVVRVHAIGAREKDGMVFMVMDLLVGRTLRELVWDLGGKMPIPWTLKIVADVARGLSAIHTLVIVHRDLKPENIHIRDDGHVSLFDLGTARIPKAARLTTKGYTLGTLDYMSPEQLLDPDAIDARSDLFGLGAILYELLTGRSPFAGTGDEADDKQAIGLRITVRPHPPLAQAKEAKHVPPYVAGIVERLLAKKPADRYASAEVVADLLERALAKFEHDLRQKGLSALPLSKLGEVPRRPPAAEEEASPSANTSTSPFLSISLPPDETTPRSRKSGPRARSLAYASTEKISVGAYATPQVSVAAPRDSSRTGTGPEGRVAWVPSSEEGEALDDEALEVVALEEEEAPEASLDEERNEWSFESVAKLEREPMSRGLGSDKLRMLDFDPAGDPGLDTLAPHEASFPGGRARLTAVLRARPRSPVVAVLLVVLTAAAVSTVGVVVLWIVGVLGPGRMAGQRPASSSSVAPRPATSLAFPVTDAGAAGPVGGPVNPSPSARVPEGRR